MKSPLILHESDILPGTENLDPSDFFERQAARAVVLNELGQVALLKVGDHNHHKLPGGGVEDGEDMRRALERELLEEIGCEAEVVAEVGEVVEYRDQWKMKQISYCYLAKQVGEQQATSFTQEELDDGFEVIWAANIDEAISLLERDDPVNYDGRFIKPRDLAFLMAAKRLL